MITNAEDKYDTLVVDCSVVMAKMREELNELEEYMESDPHNLPHCKVLHNQLKFYHDALNEIL